MSLFPDLDQVPALPEPRWMRITATLGAERRVLAVEIELIAVSGARVASRAYYPPPGQIGSLDPFADALRFGYELTTD
jgi:hypothetical protein